MEHDIPVKRGRPKVARVLRTCDACGTQFLRRVTEATKSGRYFCNAVCRNAHGVKPKTGSYKECEGCGDPFWVVPAVRHVSRFCSRPCKDQSNRRQTSIDCDFCGLTFVTHISRNARFCSRNCYANGRMQRPLQRRHNGRPAFIDGPGYVWVWQPDHHNAEMRKGWVAEHRLVAEQKLGRPIGSHEHVHHVNRIKHDNRPVNLAVVDAKTHALLTKEERQNDRELLAEYIRRFGPLN